jgi:hypothetical protein
MRPAMWISSDSKYSGNPNSSWQYEREIQRYNEETMLRTMHDSNPLQILYIEAKTFSDLPT